MAPSPIVYFLNNSSYAFKEISQTLGLFTHSNFVLGLNGLVHTGFLFSKLNWVGIWDEMLHNSEWDNWDILRKDQHT